MQRGGRGGAKRRFVHTSTRTAPPPRTTYLHEMNELTIPMPTNGKTKKTSGLILGVSARSAWSHLGHDELLPLPLPLVTLPAVNILGKVQAGEKAVLSKRRAEQPSSVGERDAVVLHQLREEHAVHAGTAAVDPSELGRLWQELAQQVFAALRKKKLRGLR